MNSSLNSNSNQVNVYVRNYKKHAMILSVSNPTCGQQLRQKIRRNYNPEVKNFAIFFKGKSIQQNTDPLIFQKTPIVHLVDLERIHLPTLNIIFKFQKMSCSPIKVYPQTVIRDVLRDSIKPVIGKGETQVFLVYLGKPMNIFKKFEEEFVEDSSQIVIVEFKKKKQEPIAFKKKQEEEKKQPKKEETTSAELVKQQSHGELDITAREFKQSADIRDTIKLESPAIGSVTQQDMNMIMKKKASIQQKANFEGFNPHTAPSAAPSAAPGSAPQIFKEQNLTEVQTAPPQNPQKGSPNAKIEDLLFSGAEQLPQTQNLTSGAAKELKESLKKSKSKESGS